MIQFIRIILHKKVVLPAVVTLWERTFPFRLIAISPIENYRIYNLVNQLLWAFLSLLSGGAAEHLLAWFS